MVGAWLVGHSYVPLYRHIRRASSETPSPPARIHLFEFVFRKRDTGMGKTDNRPGSRLAAPHAAPGLPRLPRRHSGAARTRLFDETAETADYYALSRCAVLLTATGLTQSCLTAVHLWSTGACGVRQ